MNEFFRKFSHKLSLIVWSVWAFFVAFVLILSWILTGPIFNFSDTWQLVINTTTTIITFLMVFIIQNTQNRDTKSIQLKLDELIRSQIKARNSLLDLENTSDEELAKIQKEFDVLYQKELNIRKKSPNTTAKNTL